MVFFSQNSCRGHDARLAEVDNKAQSDYLMLMARTLGKGRYSQSSIDPYWLICKIKRFVLPKKSYISLKVVFI